MEEFLKTNDGRLYNLKPQVGSISGTILNPNNISSRSSKGSSDHKVKASQHLSAGRGDIDPPFAPITIIRNILEAPCPPGAGPYIQGDITDFLPTKIIDMPDFGWNLLGFNLAPHKNPLGGGGERGIDTRRHPVLNFCTDAGLQHVYLCIGCCRLR